MKGLHEGFTTCKPVSVACEPVGQNIFRFEGEDGEAFVIVNPCVFELECI